MIIKIDNIKLAEGGVKSAVDLRRGGDGFSLQVADGLRWTDVEVLDRNNRSNSFSFMVWREHDTAEKAATFVLDHAADAERVGLITFETSTGTSATRRFMNGACKVATAYSKGRSSFFAYQLTGGALRKTEA